MSVITKFSALFITSIIVLSTIAFGGSLKGGDIVYIESDEVFLNDLYITCREANFSGTAEGDVLVACQKFTLDGKVKQNLYAAAQDIKIEGEVEGDIIGFAQDIVISGKALSGFRGGCQSLYIEGIVEGDILVGAAWVTIAPEAMVRGDIYIGAGELLVEGEVHGSVKGGCGSLVVAGLITEDVELEVEKIRFRGDGRIEGDLVYRSEKPVEGDFRERVGGEIVYKPVEKEVGKALSGLCLIFKIILFISALATGLIISLAFKDRIRETLEVVREKFWLTLLVGFLGFAAIPAAAVIFMIVVITIPAALVLATLYLIFLYLGWILAGILLGTYILDIHGTGSPSVALSALLGIAILSIIGFIPFLGGVVCFIAVLMGMGIILTGLHRLFWSE